MGLFKRKSGIRAASLFHRWLRPIVPEGHASLEAYESLLGDDERERLRKTLAKLAMDGVERIHVVRNHDLDPDRDGLVYLDELLDAELRWKLTEEQDPNHPRNLFRLVVTEFGCIVGEIYVRTGKGEWIVQRAPNIWRSHIHGPGGEIYDPFLAVVRQMSDEREEGALTRHYDSIRSGIRPPGL
ncbi:MAG: hypothetical protein ACYSX0_08465 [Planctomycetota bacterium]